MKKISTSLTIIALLLIPLAIWFEKSETKTWQQRLLIPVFEEEPNRHTPIFTNGYFLPPEIKQNTTLRRNDGPIILAQKTTVQENATLAIEPGTEIYAHEFSSLTIKGELRSMGTKTRPIIFKTNEAHPENQTWDGIILAGNSKSKIEHTIINQASTGITCEPQSQATIQNTKIYQSVEPIFSQSEFCTVSETQ